MIHIPVRLRQRQAVFHSLHPVRIVNLTEKEYLIIKEAAEERSLGSKGFSTVPRVPGCCDRQ